MYRYLRRISGRFTRSEQGVGAIEFALTAPLVLLTVLGSIEFAHYVWASEGARWASSTMGRLYARHSSLDDRTYKAISKAADLMVRGYATGGVDITTTSVLICKGTQGTPSVYVTWEQGWNGERLTNGRRPGSKYLELENAEVYVSGSTVLVTEVEITYEPKIKYLWKNGVTSDENPTFKRRTVASPLSASRVGYPSLEAWRPGRTSFECPDT